MRRTSPAIPAVTDEPNFISVFPIADPTFAVKFWVTWGARYFWGCAIQITIFWNKGKWTF